MLVLYCFDWYGDSVWFVLCVVLGVILFCVSVLLWFVKIDMLCYGFMMRLNIGVVIVLL